MFSACEDVMEGGAVTPAAAVASGTFSALALITDLELSRKKHLRSDTKSGWLWLFYLTCLI